MYVNVSAVIGQFIVLQPRFGSILGGTFIQVIGRNIRFKQGVNFNYTCKFDKTEVQGIFNNQSGVDKILCVSPILSHIGNISFTLSYSDTQLNNTEKTVLKSDTFLSCKS